MEVRHTVRPGVKVRIPLNAEAINGDDVNVLAASADARVLGHRFSKSTLQAMRNYLAAAPSVATRRMAESRGAMAERPLPESPLQSAARVTSLSELEKMTEPLLPTRPQSSILDGPHYLAGSLVTAGPLAGQTIGETGIVSPAEPPAAELIAADCTLDMVKKAILENKDFKDLSIAYTDKVVKTDESMTKDEIVEHAKTLGDMGAEVDAWGLAYFYIDVEGTTKSRFIEPDCCCIWVESINIILTRQLFIAKDIPKDEREQTVWHEEQHFKSQAEVFEGKKFRDAIAAIVAGIKFDKKNPDCKRIKPKSKCDDWSQELWDDLHADLVKPVNEAAAEVAQAAEDFHDKEDDLWKKHKAGQKK